MDKKIIHTVFEENVNKYPFYISIEAENAKVTYVDLNIYANRLAHLLLSMGCCPGMIVNVFIPSSITSIAALLAVFKTGGIYLPVDPAFSQKRMWQIFDETFDGMVITSDTLYNDFIALCDQFKVSVKCLIVISGDGTFSVYNYAGGYLNTMAVNETAAWAENPVADLNGDSSSYIFYTSGSTGQGKAIVGTHAGLSHFIHWEIMEFGINESFRVSHLTQVTFDASLRDIFVPLASGGTVCIPSPETKNNPLHLLEWLERSKVSMVHCVPSLFRIWTKELEAAGNKKYELTHLRYILLAGELLYAKDILSWRKAMGEKIGLVNLYGATETTLVKTFFRIGSVPENPSQIIPVGIPVSNTSIAVIRNGRMCKSGETGEIYIKTPFATKGYYKNDELTAESFVQNPLHNDFRDIVYKTGDLGRYLPDNNLEVLGRLDNQVKINGIRIELLEVEQAMLDQVSITGAVVTVYQTDDHISSLIAYYTGKEMKPEELRDRLAMGLHQQAIPSWFIYLNEFPLNINGKIDKKALPSPDQAIRDNTGGERYIGEIENKLALQWKEILGHDKAGRNISFFAIGGNSLRAIQLISRIHKTFGVNCKITDIFMQPTIQGQAAFIAGSLKRKYEQIRPIAEKPYYDLSACQRRLWILSQFEEGNIAYNMPGIYLFEGDLHFASLEHSFNMLIARHEILRTVFKEDENGGIKQFVNRPEATEFKITCRDLRGEKEEVVAGLAQMEFKRPFSLATGPLLRTVLLQVQEDKWVFIYVMHHIISDAWSMSILIDELLQLYNAHRQGLENPLKPLLIQYKDYAAWQREQLNGDRLQEHKAWWLKQLEGDLPVLDLPADRPRPAVKTYNGDAISKFINPDLSRQFKAMLQEQDGTLFMGLLAAVNGLLYRYTGQKDIIIGSPIAGREHVDLEDQIGFYVNTLALRTRFKNTDSYKDLVENIKRTTLGAYEHQLYPFDELVDELQLHRDISRNPLFDVQVIVQNGGLNTKDQNRQFRELNVSGYAGAKKLTSVFDMVFNFSDSESGLGLYITYNSDIYSGQLVTQLADHLEQLMDAIVQYPDSPINQLNFLGEKDRQRLLVGFNDTEEIYPSGQTLVSLFEIQVRKIPDEVAVVFLGKAMTYRELDEQSDRLALHLIKNYNIAGGELVGIMADRSEKMIISILGILKAGGAYVPIDAAYPQARKEYILRDTGARVLLTQSDYMFGLEYYQGGIIALDIQLDGMEDGDPGSRPIVEASQLAYVIYTSGSTGVPKGVMVEHGAVVNTIYAQRAIFDVQAGERHLQFASCSFDASVSEIFVSLAAGATLYIIDDDTKKEPSLLQQYINGNKIDMGTIPPAYLKLLAIEKLGTMKKLVTAGEAAIYDKAVEFCGQGIYYNAYGPTETSICATVYKMDRGGPIAGSNVPIGGPIANAEVYILDESGNLQPEGAIGEICISGKGLARGYLNQPELTAEKFVPNPFKESGRMYKTGDSGKWLPDGNIVFTGRRDEQVKIRGYRIELGEIANALLSHPDIVSAVVVAGSAAGEEKELVAYLVGKVTLPPTDVRAHLSQLLPGYMIPPHFVQMDALPVTINGKIDRKKLPDPRDNGLGTGLEYIAPRNETEEKLAAIWARVLEKEKISVKDDYFDLGGNSLKALIIIKKIHDEIGHILSIKTLFAEKNIENIARIITEIKNQVDPGAHADAVPGSSLFTDASYNQLNYFSKWKIGNDNVVLPYRYTNLKVEAFETAIYKLVERHEILRTVFVDVNGIVKQRILPLQESRVGVGKPIPVSSFNEMITEIELENKRRIDLYGPQLFFIKIFQPENDVYYVVFTMHHIITDGYSSGILKEELTELYNAALQDRLPRLKPLPFQYRDFSAWQRKFVDSAAGISHRDYWMEKLRSISGAIKAPLHSDPAAADAKDPVLITKTINGKLLNEIDRFAKTNGCTRSGLLLASLMLFQNQLNGEEDIAITVSVSGRHSKYYGELDVSGLIGLFVNTLFVWNAIDRDKPIRDFIVEVQNNFLDHLNYETYPFVKAVGESPDIDPDILKYTGFFNYHNYSYYNELSYEEDEQEKIGKTEKTGPMSRALGLSVEEYDNCLKLQLKINPAIFPGMREATIKDRYLTILHKMLYNSELPVNQQVKQTVD